MRRLAQWHASRIRVHQPGLVQRLFSGLGLCTVSERMQGAPAADSQLIVPCSRPLWPL
jgi:hypothetical protein